ncbi:MAG: hypothetical protein ABGZ35_30395 [Planctomycetaceae bacterium]
MRVCLYSLGVITDLLALRPQQLPGDERLRQHMHWPQERRLRVRLSASRWTRTTPAPVLDIHRLPYPQSQEAEEERVRS